MIAYVKSFERVKKGDANITDVLVDPGGKALINPEHFAACGDDSPPLDTDYAILVPTGRSGVFAVAGYVDPKNTQDAKGGEKRLYARDSEGNVVSVIWMKNDGTVVVENENATSVTKPDGEISNTNAGGYFKLEAGGTFEVNGVKILPDGTIITPKEVQTPKIKVNGKEIDEHNHNETGTVTGPNN
jgi:hypothetical protein